MKWANKVNMQMEFSCGRKEKRKKAIYGMRLSDGEVKDCAQWIF